MKPWKASISGCASSRNVHLLGVHQYFWWWWWWWQRIKGRSADPRPNEWHERVTTHFLQVCVRCGLTLGRLNLHFPSDFNSFSSPSSLSSHRPWLRLSLPCTFTSLLLPLLVLLFQRLMLLLFLPLLSPFCHLFLFIQLTPKEGLLSGRCLSAHHQKG